MEKAKYILDETKQNIALLVHQKTKNCTPMKKRWRIIPHERIKLSNVENDASPGPSKKEIVLGKKKLRGNGSVGIVKITLQSLVQ